MLQRCRIDKDARVLERSVDLRYLRQAYELNVLTGGKLTASTLSQMAENFHDKHESTYGHANRNEGVQLVTLRVTALGKLTELTLDAEDTDDEE